MPTGLTHDIPQGKSFKKFVLDCARHFGALIHMRDEPMDAKITKDVPSDYHKKALKESEKKLKKLRKLSLFGALKIATRNVENEFKEANDYNAKQIAKQKKEKIAYEKVLEQVKAWKPPTKDHVNLKKFMTEQIEETIEHDCNPSYYQRPVEKKNPGQYLFDLVESVKKEIKYHRKEWENDVKRADGRNKWITDLFKSVDIPFSIIVTPTKKRILAKQVAIKKKALKKKGTKTKIRKK